MKKLLTVFSLIVLTAFVSACGQVSNDRLVSANSNSQQPLQGEEDLSLSPEVVWNSIEKEGYASGGPFQGHKVLTVDQESESVQFSLPLFDSTIRPGTYSIPNLPGATAKIKGYWVQTVTVNVPLKYAGSQYSPLVNFQGNQDPKKLPNGDPLPGIPGGELPKAAFKIPVDDEVDLYVYIASKYLAVFVETHEIDPTFDFEFPIKSFDGSKTVGYLATVSAKNGYSGGFWLSMALPAQLARLIEDFLN